MKTIITMAIVGMVAATQAATVIYNFNNDASGYAGADVTDFSGTASDIILVDGNGTADLTSLNTPAGNTGSGTLTDGTDTFAGMSPGASTDLGVTGDPTATDGSGYLAFTLTPNSGESLDFTGMSYQATVASFTTVNNGDQETRAALWYSIDGSAFAQIGSTLTIMGNPDTLGTERYTDLQNDTVVTYDGGTGTYTRDNLDISLNYFGSLNGRCNHRVPPRRQQPADQRIPLRHGGGRHHAHPSARCNAGSSGGQQRCLRR